MEKSEPMKPIQSSFSKKTTLRIIKVDQLSYAQSKCSYSGCKY